MAGFGLRLARASGMTDGYSGGLQEFNIDPANTNPIFTGDPVALDANGFAEEAIAAGASGNDFTILGIFMGCRYVGARGDYEFVNQWDGGAGRSDAIAHVAIPSGGMFYVKGDAGTDYTGVNVDGQRFGMLAVAGSTAYGDSRATLGAGPAATGPLIVHRLATLPANDLANEPTFECHVVRQQGYFTEA